MKEGRFNTIQEDKEIFQKERLSFVDELRKFKYGYASYGLAAINSLESMYKSLIYSVHVSQDEKKAKSYIDEIIKVRTDIITHCTNPSRQTGTYVNTQGQPVPSQFVKDKPYQQLIIDIETLYEKLLVFKKDAGMG